MAPLKILQIVPSISLVYGGPSQMVRGLSSALAQLDTEVTVLTTDANGDVDEAPLAVPLGQPVVRDGYETLYFRCAPFRRYKFSPALLRWLWQNAPDYDIAHIHALFSPVSTAAATLCRWRQLPYLMRPLGTLDPADLRKKKQFKALYAALLERPNLAGAAAIHFTSELEAKVSERFGVTTPDLVLPLGVCLPPIGDDKGGGGAFQGDSTSNSMPSRALAQTAIRQRFDIPEGQPLLLFMSRIDPKKGFDVLLPALSNLQQQGQPFHLLLCGANPQDRAYEARIHEQIQAAPWAQQATVTGFISGELKRQLLAAADVFVLPSYYENFGIAVAEAMAAGLPVVISDQVHIWPTIQASEAGWVVPVDVEALTAALKEALVDSQVRSHRGQNARQCAQAHYSWDAIAQRLLNHYQQIIRTAPRKPKATH